jgi:hypothetical protein
MTGMPCLPDQNGGSGDRPTGDDADRRHTNLHLVDLLVRLKS